MVCAAVVDGAGHHPDVVLTDGQLDEAVHHALHKPANQARAAEVAGHLGIALTSVLNTIGPDEVVLTGLLGRLAEATPKATSAALAASVVARVRGTTYRIGTDYDAALAGAAELAFQRLLADPGPWHPA